MKHWIVDSQVDILSNWQEAFPRCNMLAIEQARLLPDSAKGLVWCRLRHGMPVSDAMSGLKSTALRKVVVLADDPIESVIMECLALGASGCCNTHAASEVLRQVALVVGNGGLWVGQSLLQMLLGSTTRLLERQPVRSPRTDWGRVLSEREVEVARLVARGASNKEIASQLSVTERTVKAHLTAIFEKLGLRDRLQLSLRINGVVV